MQIRVIEALKEQSQTRQDHSIILWPACHSRCSMANRYSLPQPPLNQVCSTKWASCRNPTRRNSAAAAWFSASVTANCAVLAKRVEHIRQHGSQRLRGQALALVGGSQSHAQLHLPGVVLKEVDTTVANDSRRFRQDNRQLEPRAGGARDDPGLIGDQTGRVGRRERIPRLKPSHLRQRAVRGDRGRVLGTESPE